MRAIALALVLVASPMARASDITLFGAEAGQDFHSPQRWATEIKFGPYSPDIDSTPGLNGKTPFSDLFNNQLYDSNGKYNPGANKGQRPAGKALTTVEVDWQFLQGFGSLGVAASLGISRRSTHSFNYVGMTPGAACTVPDCTRSGDTTTLTVMPLTLELVYRFDVLARRFNVPIVPYVKGGFGYFFWWVENGSGGLSNTDMIASIPNSSASDRGIGGTLGLVAHPGIALLLDTFDPQSAQTMDNELGINHSYLFFELNYDWITGMGIQSAGKMVLSDLTWNAGVAFEF